MTAIELHHADGRTAGIFYCSQCRVVHKKQHLAKECCEPKFCGTCSQPFEAKYHRVCQRCRDIESMERHQKRIDSAELVSEYEGWLFCEEVPGGQDGYFHDMDELTDAIHWGGVDPPEFAFCCRSRVLTVAMCDILERLDDNGWEEMTEHCVAGSVEKLQTAIDEFNADNASVFTVYELDYTRKVAIPSEQPASA